jgi:hypothetical protein
MGPPSFHLACSSSSAPLLFLLFIDLFNFLAFQCEGKHQKLPFKWKLKKILIFQKKLKMKSYFSNIGVEKF